MFSGTNHAQKLRWKRQSCIKVVINVIDYIFKIFLYKNITYIVNDALKRR